MPQAPRPTSRPLKILSGNEFSASHQDNNVFSDGSTSSFAGNDLRARAIFAKVFGNLSTESLILPKNFTGWAFYNDNPDVLGDAVTALYINESEIVRVDVNAFGVYSLKPTGLIVNLGSSSFPFDSIYGNSIVGTAVGGSTGSFTVLQVGTTNQGDILYDNGTSFVRLTPGTSGYLLQTNGAAANPSWVAPPSAGAPTTADYLVGTSNGSLSAEIVVGTSPGGELGGTWASPTVDALHAGSYHPRGGTQSADQSIDTVSTTNANGVKFAVNANETLAVHMVAEITCTTMNTQGVRWTFTGPTSWAGRYSYHLESYTAAGAITSEQADRDVDATGTITFAAPTGTTTRITLDGRFTSSSTTGTITFQFAKNVDTDANNITLKRGSMITAVPS